MVLLPFGFDTPSLRLEGSNATPHSKFNIVRDIPDEPDGAVTSDDVYDIGHGLAAVQSAMKSSAALSEARDAVLEFEERFSQFSEVICTG